MKLMRVGFVLIAAISGLAAFSSSASSSTSSSTSSSESSSTLESESRASCQRPKGNPYACPFAVADGESDVWIGVRDKASPYYFETNPVYIGREFGGPVPCQRFALYFYKHRAQLSQVSCGIGFYGLNPNSPSAYIYVKVGTKPFQYPAPSANQLDYLELGGGPLWSIHARAERELDNCNKTLAFAKAYEASCPL